MKVSWLFNHVLAALCAGGGGCRRSCAQPCNRSIRRLPCHGCTLGVHALLLTTCSVVPPAPYAVARAMKHTHEASTAACTMAYAELLTQAFSSLWFSVTYKDGFIAGDYRRRCGAQLELDRSLCPAGAGCSQLGAPMGTGPVWTTCVESWKRRLRMAWSAWMITPRNLQPPHSLKVTAYPRLPAAQEGCLTCALPSLPVTLR